MKSLLAFVVVLFIAGCAAHQPIVDMKGVDQVRYDQDLKECQSYTQQAVSPGTGAAVGAGIGAALGLALAVATGSKNVAGQVAGGGAVIGGAQGAGDAAKTQRAIVNRCMAGRGYHVLN